MNEIISVVEQPHNVKYQVGTSFLKKFIGYGVWEGRITSFNDDNYEVIYPEDGYVEQFDCSSMDEVMTQSNKLTEKKVRVVNRETGMKMEPTEDKKPQPETISDKIGTQTLFQNGQHVWVVIGKEKHHAVIHSIVNDSSDELPKMAKIKWSVLNKLEDVEMNSLLPMFQEGTYSKRNRKQTDKYAPPLQVSKSANDMVPVSQKRKAKQEEPSRVPNSGVVSIKGSCGNGALSARLPEDINYCSYFCSADCPMKLGINHETGVANEPVEHTKECKHKKISASIQKQHRSNTKREAAIKGWTTRRKKKAVSPPPIDDPDNQGQDGGDSYLSNCEPNQFKDGQNVWVCSGKANHPAVIESIANDAKNTGPKMARVRWTTTNTLGEVEVNNLLPMFNDDSGESSSFSKRKRKETTRYTPLSLKKIKVQETPMPNMHAEVQTTSRALLATRKGNAKVEDSDFIRENLDTFVQVPRGVAPGPGWKFKMEKSRRRWISPGKAIIFRTPRAAFEFETIIQQCNGDESKALNMYKNNRRAAGKKSAILWQGATQDKMASTEAKSNAKMERDENRTISEIENDYKSLWTYYLKPTTRENEELPNGMILRKKQASCNLLRFRNSVFRSKLHRKIIRLEKQGRKDEILRLLQSIHDHDKSMKSGDGPECLLEEILGKYRGDEDIEILDSVPINASQVGIGKRVSNDVKDLAEQSSSKPTKELAGCCSPAENDYPLAGISAKREQTKLASVEGTVSESVAKNNTHEAEAGSMKSPPEIPREVIDLCEDNGLDSKPSHQQKAVQNILQEWLSEETTACSSRSSTIRDTAIRSENDHEQISKIGTPRDLSTRNAKEDAFIGTCATNSAKTNGSQGAEAGNTGSLPEIHQDVIDICKDNGLGSKPSRQQEAVQNVLQEWLCEETTASISSSSVIRDTGDHVQMPTIGIPSDVSTSIAQEDATTEKCATAAVEVGNTCDLPEILQEVIDLCEDNGLDPKPSCQQSAEETTMVSEDRRVNNNKQMPKHAISADAMKGIQNCINPSQESNHASDKQPEVIDLSQEEEGKDSQPPPTSETSQTIPSDEERIFNYDLDGNPLSPEQRQTLLDEQRQLYENIMQEKAANDAAIAQANNVDEFNLRSSSAAAQIMPGGSR